MVLGLPSQQGQYPLSLANTSINSDFKELKLSGESKILYVASIDKKQLLETAGEKVEMENITQVCTFVILTNLLSSVYDGSMGISLFEMNF